MTENEIKKALEIHAQRGECAECPYAVLEPGRCQIQLFTDCIGLIDRYELEISIKNTLLCKAESKIKALEMDNAQLQSDIVNANMNCEHVQAENERLNAMVEAAENYLHPLPFKNAVDEEIKKTQVKAIKEFAERLKKKATTVTGIPDTRCLASDRQINNLVKEMVGEG